MKIKRVFLSQPLATGQSIQVTDETAHYIRTVLRLKQGTSLVVFNGEGGEYQATIADTTQKKSLILKLGGFQPEDIESPLKTILAVGITRGERMDYAVQKSVELGVTRIVPLLTEYCVVKLNSSQAKRKQTHWQRIAEHACEQCGRTRVPSVEQPVTLSDWLQQPFKGNKFLFQPDQSLILSQIEPVNQQVSLLIGPEGGFSDFEIARTIEADFQSVSLGPRILRAETAVVAALTSLQLIWGDL